MSKHDYNFGMLLVIIGIAFLAIVGASLGAFLAALILFS